MSRGSFSLGMRASSPGGTTQARPMKRARKSTTYDYTGPLVLPAYGHERQKQRRSHGSFQVPAASRPSAPRDPPPAVSKPALRKPPPAAPARLAVQRVWDRAQYAWPRVKQALEEEYDLVLTEAADETAGLAAWSKSLYCPLVKVPHWRCFSSALAQGAPGTGLLGTPRVRPRHSAPSHCLGSLEQASGQARLGALGPNSYPLSPKPPIPLSLPHAGLVILCSKHRSPLWGERGTAQQREVMRECRGAVFEKATGRAVCACDLNTYTDTRGATG